MALYSGGWEYGGVEILLWADPKRWRITIWRGPVKLKRLHDKDRQRILGRARVWVDKNVDNSARLMVI